MSEESEAYVQMKLADLNDLVNCIQSSTAKQKIPPYGSVKEEFNKFVRTELNTRRAKSSITNLRTLHNEIKRALIENVAKVYRAENKTSRVNLLDIAVGRGGDLSKWKSAGITNVFGFDKSRDSIESINPFNQGARERLKNIKNLKTNVQFEVCDATKPTRELNELLVSFMEKNGIELFEMMSCQFAVHYFFESEKSLRRVFEAFSPFIKPGGYFIGTTVDGAKIIELPNPFVSPLLTVTKDYKAKNPRLKYNNRYRFKINDSQDQGNYFNTMGESIEYLVSLDELIRISGEYNFEPVFINFFEEYTDLDKKTKYTKSSGFVSFEEINQKNFLKTSPLTPNEKQINDLYTTFVFKKSR